MFGRTVATIQEEYAKLMFELIQERRWTRTLLGSEVG